MKKYENYAVMVGSNCVVVTAKNKKDAFKKLRVKYDIKLKDVYKY